MKLEHLYDQGVIPIHAGAILLCVGFLAAGWAFGVRPLMSESQQSNTVLEQAEQAEFEAKQVKVQLDQLAAELASVQEELNEQPVNLQSASQINPLLSELANWSEQHGLSITRTSAGRREALVYYDYVPIEVSGEGGYTDLLGFFTKLHNERGDLGLISFAVNRMPTGGVSFEMDLAWYVLSDESQEGSGQPGQATASVRTE